MLKIICNTNCYTEPRIFNLYIIKWNGGAI